MGWTDELYKVYELVSQKGDEGLLPLSHSIKKAQVEVTVDENGDFVQADTVNKKYAETIHPDTEASGGRTSTQVAPKPLADKLKYTAGDYSVYVDGANADDSKYFVAYLSQLKEWCESGFSHPLIKAVYAYLEKGELIQDLIGSGVMHIDEKTGKLSNIKFDNDKTTKQTDAFVRFIVSTSKGLFFTWKDTSLYESFINFNSSKATGNLGLCYATGKIAEITYKHPKNINYMAANAKLISANDDNGFTYRGRFIDEKEAFAVSSDYSQKMHKALKWLISSQSEPYDKLMLITWNSALGFVPSVTKSAFEMHNNKQEEYSTAPDFSEMLNKSLIGERANIDFNSKVMIMGLDAATPGRLSISLYTELAQSQFYENLKKWHEGTKWRRYNGTLKQNIEDSCSLDDIADCLYGTEQSGFLKCDKKIMKDLILRLLPCVSEGKKLPKDIVQTLYNKASSPMSYEKQYNHRKVVENACALIRKEYIDYNKGVINMAYDPNCTDRSYLYGCLLAIADKAESDTYKKDEKRTTNARRLWSAFSARPYQTWQIIEERLEPYLEKEHWAMTKYTKHINEIMTKLSPEAFADNSKLSPMYLIGYHHYNALLWAGKQDNNEEE